MMHGGTLCPSLFGQTPVCLCDFSFTSILSGMTKGLPSGERPFLFFIYQSASMPFSPSACPMRSSSLAVGAAMVW